MLVWLRASSELRPLEFGNQTSTATTDYEDKVTEYSSTLARYFPDTEYRVAGYSIS